MPENIPEEGNPTTSGEGGGRQHRQQDREQGFTREAREQRAAQQRETTLPFDNAFMIAEVVAAIDDGEAFSVDQEEIDNFKRILVRYGHFLEGDINNLPPEQIFVEAHALLKNAQVGQILPSSRLQEQREEAETLIQAAKEAENIDAEGVAELVDVQESEQPSEPAGDFSQNFETFQREVDAQMQRAREMVGLTEVRDEQGRVSYDPTRASYHAVQEIHSEVSKGLARFRKQINPDIARKIKRFLGEEGPKRTLSQRYRSLYNDLSVPDQQTLFGDIDQQSTVLLKSIQGGWRENPESAIRGFVRRHDVKDIDPMREWRLYLAVEGLRDAITVKQLTETPADWREIPNKITNVFSFIEATDFSVDELEAAIQDAIILVRSMPPDIKEGRVVREKLIKELEAFREVHRFRIQMQRGDMDPEKVHYDAWTEETWIRFVGRFGEDRLERQFVRKVEGKDEPVNVNLFDEALKLYFGRMQEERKTLNLVEGLTKIDIYKGKLTGSDFQLIEELLFDTGLGFGRLRSLTDPEKKELEDLRKTFTEGKYQINREDWGTGTLNNWLGVQKWYRENKLLGAITGDMDIRRGEMRGQLKDKLKGLHLQLKDKKTGELKAFDDGGLEDEDSEEWRFLESAEFSAYNFAFTFAWSDFDGIRIYNSHSKKIDYMEDFVFSPRSSLWSGRHIDHPWEFFTNEKRGRSEGEDDVNEQIRQRFPGRHHNMLPNNRTMMRFVHVFAPNWRTDYHIEERARIMMKQFNFDTKDPEKEFEFFDWARKIVAAELFDAGEIDFSQQNFSETAHLIKKYEMGDLGDDRGATKKFLSKEVYQAYLANPTEEEFLRVHDKLQTFYSGRNFREWPYMNLATHAHVEFASHDRLRLFNKANLTSARGELLVNQLIDGGDMERWQGDEFKRQHFGFAPGVLGTTPLRRIRQNLEIARRAVWEGKLYPLVLPLIAIWESAIEFVKRLPGQIAGK